MYRNNRRAYRPVKSPKWPFVLLVVFVLLLLGAGSFAVLHKQKPDTATSPNGPGGSTSTTQDQGTKTSTPPSFDKTKFSLTDPTSLWVVVNKQRPLNPKDYAPSDLRLPDVQVDSAAMVVRDEMATALETMFAAAANDGIHLTIASAYRSYDTQVSTYQSVVNAYGQTEADRESARPGHSEHQTGWAADLGAANGKCRIQTCFADTPEGKWLAANAYKYGFVIRYPDGKESITGYMYEPWHVRYTGKDLSEEMHRTGIQTLEEFFGLPAAPNY